MEISEIVLWILCASAKLSFSPVDRCLEFFPSFKSKYVTLF